MPYKDEKKRKEYKKKWNKQYYKNNKRKERNRIANRKYELKSWFKQYKSTLKHQKSPFAISQLQLGVRRRFLSAQEHAIGSFEMQGISNVLRKHKLSDIRAAVLDMC